MNSLLYIKKRAHTRFYLNYNTSSEEYYKLLVNQILKNKKSEIVVYYKECILFSDNNEYLMR